MNARGRDIFAAAVFLVALIPVAAQSPSGIVLVSYSGEHKVALIDAATGKVESLLSSGKGPHEITVSRDGTLAYVAISGAGPRGEPGNSITVIDLTHRAVKDTFMLTDCRQPHDTRLSRDGARLWVACAPAQAVLELDARTGEVLRTFKTNLDGGWFVEVTPDERKLYVPHLEGKALSVIDRKSGAARAVYSGSTQFGLSVSPAGREVWVSDSDQHKLTIVDTRSDRVRGSISLGAPPQGESGSARLRFTPDGRSVAVVRGDRFLLVDARRRVIAWTADLPHGGKVVAVSGDGRHAFVTHPGNDAFSVVDLVARKVLATHPTGNQPDGIAWVARPQR